MHASAYSNLQRVRDRHELMLQKRIIQPSISRVSPTQHTYVAFFAYLCWQSADCLRLPVQL